MSLVNYNELISKYERGLQVVFVLAGFVTFFGKLFNYLNYSETFSAGHQWMYLISELFVVVAMLLFFFWNRKWYPQLFVVVSFSIVGTIFLNHLLFHDELNVGVAGVHDSKVFIRDTFFVVCYISFVAFVSGKIWAFIQMCMHLFLLIFYAFIIKDEFVLKNFSVFITGLLGFYLVLHFLVTSVNKFLDNLKSAHRTISEQSLVLKEKNEEISSSINYAKHLQVSSLPKVKLDSMFNKSFLIYKPKDIVSGDYYWLAETDKFKLFCVADCTGHGIPGAFVSLLGTVFMNESHYSKSYEKPDEILNEVNSLLKFTLDNDNKKMYDGMDVSFCALEKSTNKLFFSGAINPVWILTKRKELKGSINYTEPKAVFEEVNLFAISGDDYPIGNYVDDDVVFKCTEIQLEPEDRIILFSDGYADQFGGEHGKKMQKKRFRKILLESFASDMNEVHTILENKFDHWKGENEQLDDVCVMGVEIE